MDRFPQEIISAILGNFNVTGHINVIFPLNKIMDWSNLINFATISRQWQFAVERFTLRDIRLKSTDLEHFANLLRPSQSHRHAFVKGLRFDIILPSYTIDACSKYETEDEKETSSRVFSEAIHGLFNVLKEVESGGGIFLTVNAYSFLDPGRIPHVTRQRLFDGPADLWTKRFQTSFLRLRDPEKLPILSNFWGVDCSATLQCKERSIEPASIVAMIAKTKGLKKGTLEFYDGDGLDIETRQVNRYNLAMALSAPTLEVMDDARFFFSGPVDHHKTPPNLILPGSAVEDPLNRALHKLMTRAGVRWMSLYDLVVAPELFWPSPDMAAITSPVWPNLELLEVNIPIDAPDGGRYLIADQASDSDEGSNDENEGGDESEEGDEGEGENSDESSDAESDNENAASYPSSDYRGDKPNYIPNPARINPLLIAMARAARHAPSLEWMQLGIRHPLRHICFKVWYAPKGISAWVEEEPEDKARVVWQVGDWRPNEEVQRHWRDVISSDGVMLYIPP